MGLLFFRKCLTFLQILKSRTYLLRLASGCINYIGLHVYKVFITSKVISEKNRFYI
jgi:hypothetical protein